MEPETFKRTVRALLEALPSEIQAEAQRKFTEKQMERRMLPFFTTVAELASSCQLIPLSNDPAILDQAFNALVSHVERVWDDAITLLQKGSYPAALFFAIVAIEELGKVAVAKIQRVLGVPIAASVAGIGSRRSPLRSHPKKHFLAAAAGAVVNSRLDRVIGIGQVLRFIEMAEKGELERLRQECLYYDLREHHQHLPYEAVSRQEAELMVIICGELLAEVCSVTPEEWEKYLAKVDEFERNLQGKGTFPNPV
jgi:AbiV family abortive infection protein